MREIQETTGLEIAVIGMSGRFPGASNIDEYWQNLIAGVETLYFYTREELENAGVEPGLLESANYIKAGGGILEGIDTFDAAFFDYTPNEATAMHPQVRLFHESAWEALEHAGYNPLSYTGKIGLYAGASSGYRWETLLTQSGKAAEFGPFVTTMLANSNFLSTRVSYKLNLKGPAVIVQSACSTSLLAIDLACRGILTGQCDMALAGGVSVSGAKGGPGAKAAGYLYKEGLIRSEDGHCRAFDARAGGTIGGEGVGVVVLKLLEDAIADGDTVHAVIKGFAANNDGNRRVGYTAPSIEGQAEVIRAAHLMAEIAPESITYIETHGTGTTLGDPVEIEALKQGFGTEKKGFCKIGSVKTNIGHLDAAAGIASFIKVVLTLNNRMIPPSLHFQTPNPKAGLENSPFIVNTGLTPWENNKYPLRAGVSSFGIGGTNVHIVLEEAPKEAKEQATSAAEHSGPQNRLILISAKTETALEKITENLGDYFKKNPGINLADAAYTLHLGRRAFAHRRMLVCSRSEEAVEALSAKDPRKLHANYLKRENPRIIFVFPGIGAQYIDMGRELYETEPVIRKELDRCFEILHSLSGNNFKEILYPSTAPTATSSVDINQPEIAQPVLFIFEHALAALLNHWGIKPDAVIGYSFGEYAAASHAGVYTLEDALTLITARGQLMKQLPGGVMLSVPMTAEELLPLLPRDISIAIDNGPSCIVGGPAEAVTAFEKEMKKRRYMTMRAPNAHAVHTPMMKPILAEFTHRIGKLHLNPPQIPYISGVTGDWARSDEVTKPGYWAKHLGETVRFSVGIKKLLTLPNPIFIEVGPGRDLLPLVMRHIENAGSENPDIKPKMINLIRHPESKISDHIYLLNKIGQLWLNGVNIDETGFYANQKRRRKPLPTYPFAGERYWLDESSISMDLNRLMPGKATGKPGRAPLAECCYLPAWKRAIPTLKSHGTTEPTGEEKKTWLVLLDTLGLGTRLVRRLQAMGHHVVTVTAGPGYTDAGQGNYTINPEQPDDYRQLFHHLPVQPGTLGKKAGLRILHLWTLSGKQEQAMPFEKIQTLGYYSLLNIVKALSKSTAQSVGQIQLNVISDNWHDVTGEEELEPGKSTMLGPLKVIPQETPHIRCRGIDIVWPQPGETQQNVLVEQLITEITGTGHKQEIEEPLLAFRGPHRLIEEFQPLPLEKVNAGQLPLREKGVILITGGMGKIGLVLAGNLAETFKARLVLTGRTSLTNPEKIKKVRELEALGAEVMTFSCDVADESRMQDVIAEVNRQWGMIHGVIHAAGLISGNSFNLSAQLTDEACQPQFRAKIEGAVVIEKLFREQNLDFCWFMSSISSVLGGLQFTAYAAANAFLDAFVTQIKRRSTKPWISVDWDGMPPAETVAVFKRILALTQIKGKSGISRIVVSRSGNLQDRIDRWIKLAAPQEEQHSTGHEKANLHPRPQLLNPYSPPINPVQQVIAATWERTLGYEQIGIRDDFLELGGDSLKAITVISAIHKQMNAEIPLPFFFKNPTIEKLAEYIKNTETSNHTPVTPAEKREYYPLSSAQKRIYFLQQIDMNSTGYNMPLVRPLGKDFEKNRIETTLKKLIARHESLRTTFRVIGQEPFQIIHETLEFEMEFYKFTTAEGEKPERTETQIINIIKGFIRPFELSRGPLIRSGVIELPDRNYIWLLDLHHIIADGTSHTILAEDFRAIYNEETLAQLNLQYKDFSQRQNRAKRSGEIKDQEDYWLEIFSGETPRLNLPTDYKRPEVFTFSGDTHSFKLDAEEAVKFKALGAAHGGTLYMNILAVINTLFYKYTGQTDIIIGSGIAGRNHVDLQRVVGMFINTLPMRNSPQGEKTYATFLKEVIESSIQAFDNQDVQFEELIERLEPERDPSRNPLFDISMVVQNFRKPGNPKPPTAIENSTQNQAIQLEVLPEPDEKVSPIEYKNPTTKFDMTFFVREPNNQVQIGVEYYTGIFKPATIQRMETHLTTIIRTVNENPYIKLKDIDIIPPEEKTLILNTFNNPSVDNPTQKTILHLYADQVKKISDRVAVVGTTVETDHNDMSLTYRVIDETAGQLANYLYKKKGVKSEEPVGVLMNQSIYRIAALIGILKAGGVYVPLDPALPGERLKYMITESGIGVVISEKKYVKDLERLQWESDSLHTYLCIDSNNIHEEDEAENNELMDIELWHHVAETANDEITGGGWTSSYTGEPLSKAEMDEYGDNILKKLEPLLHPQMKVLEIGCASGITMYRIAPKVKLYYGTDLSPAIIEKNKIRNRREGNRNIRLKALAAHEIPQIKNEINSFHIIIMNSVIQCFHGYNYLRKVIRQCVDLLEQDGILLIGDIMDQEKKNAMIRELTEFKYSHQDKETDKTTKTDFSSELFVSRGFWTDLAAEIREIETIRISDKIHTIENELTKFRYDALIKVNKNLTQRDPRKKSKNQEDAGDYSTCETSPPPCAVKPTDTAYIIYTSGTTGRPKGVMIEHRGISNLNDTMARLFKINLHDKIIQFANISFDASIWEIFMTLLNGAALHLVKKETIAEIHLFQEYLTRHNITVMTLPPPYANNLNVQGIRTLRLLITGGSAANIDFIKSCRDHFEYINAYGPTENTICSTYWSSNQDTDSSIVKIGKPVLNTQVYIGGPMGLQPIGIPGELCVTGNNLARGYLNNPELTVEKFIPPQIYTDLHRFILESCPPHSPTHPLTYSTIYRTGDLARWQPDGNIEFLGRIDHQVKIRGIRIELAEIENRLKTHMQIKEAVVISRSDNMNDLYLTAYFVLSEGEQFRKTPGQAELKENLSQTLPDYMIPTYFVQIEEIPLTTSGKVDAKALPAPGIEIGDDYAAPANEIEEKLTLLWSEILGIEKSLISVNANFFDLGGHSLKAIALISRIHKEMEVKIPLVEIFNTPTIKGLSGYIKKENKDRYISIAPVEKKEYYELSPAQKRMYILQQMETKRTGYNVTQTILLAEETDTQQLEILFKQLIARHESLRTSFHMEGDTPIQRIHNLVEFKIEEIVLPTAEEINRPKEEKNTIQNDRENRELRTANYLKHVIQPFDLSSAPLLRVGLIKNANRENLLLIDMHHIVTDGASQSILATELRLLSEGKELPPLRLQYKEYAQWQNSREQRQAIKNQAGYWRRLYTPAAEIPVLNLPIDNPRPTVQSFTGRTVEFLLTPGESRAIKTLARQADVTLFMAISAVFYVLLSKLTGQEDIILGIPLAGRRHADLEGIIGMLVNTLPLRNASQGEKKIIEFIHEVKTSTLQAFENQDYPFEELVEQLALPRETGRNPMFDVVFNLLTRNDYAVNNDKTGKDRSQPNKHRESTAKFDLTLTALDLDNTLLCSIEYSSVLFKPATIDRIILYFRETAGILAENPHRTIAGIEIITTEERDKILNEFNRPAATIPPDETIHELVIRQTRQIPGHMALVGPKCSEITNKNLESKVHNPKYLNEVQLTYRELDRQSNRLEDSLRKKGLGPDIIAAIALERSIEMVTGMLAILKTGATYLPIDPQNPQERIDYMLSDSGAKVLLSSREKTEKWNKINEKIINGQLSMVDCQRESGVENKLACSENHLHLSPAPATSLAYIIYTSGTTGKPKGVLVRHRGFVNLIYAHRQVFGETINSRMSQVANPGFDAMALEAWPCLASGAALVIVDNETRLDTTRLKQWLIEKQITISFQPTVTAERLLAENWVGTGAALKILQTGGDRLTRYPNGDHPFTLYNLYGPTEDTVCTTWTEVKPTPGAAAFPSIGKPITNHQVYITGPNLEMQPIGIPGELCIAGHGVAAGYLNKPELTAEKFIQDLWNNPDKKFLWGSPGGAVFSKSAPPGRRRQKIYRTGDLARWQPDGKIDILGRIDTQVKIRGNRIELGEIENRLLAYKEIKETVVTIQEEENGDKYLCAYFVADRELEIPAIRKYLSTTLPVYMIPAYFVPLQQIPLTPHGKLDRKALPRPAAKPADEYTAPRNPLEKHLLEIWAEVLGKNAAEEAQRIGIHDNFFEIGGHSLKATILVSRIQSAFDVKISLAEIFKSQTVSEQAKLIRQANNETLVEIAPVEKKEYYELSYNQVRMWLIHQKDPESRAFNMPGKASFQFEIDAEIARESIRWVMEKHESLRTGFKTVGEQAVQFIKEENEPPIERIDISNMNPETAQLQRNKIFWNATNAPFDLAKPPLFRTVLLKWREKNWDFIYVVHHIVSDGWSQEILIRDFQECYQALGEGAKPHGQPLYLHYKDFALWQNRQITEKELKDRAHRYWKEKLTNGIPVLRLPGDVTGETDKNAGAGYRCMVAESFKKSLMEITRRQNTTLFTVMYAAFVLLLSDFSHQTEITCSIIDAGRGDTSVHRMIGFFINSLLYTLHIEDGESYTDFIKRIHADLLETQENKLYPPELVFEELNISYPETTAAFNMLNMQDQSREAALEPFAPEHLPRMRDVKFAIELYITENRDGLEIYWAYRKSQFAPGTIEFMATEYIKLMEYFVNNASKSLADYRGAGEKRRFKKRRGNEEQ